MRTRLALIALAVLSLAAPAAGAATVPDYFTVPAGFGAGSGIAAASDGTVWFAASPANPTPARPESAIGRLIPAQASPGTANGIATFYTPAPAGTGCCANIVRGVAVDRAANRVWFVQSDSIVGWADPARVVPGTTAGMIAKLLPGVGNLWDVAADPRSGLAWFTERDSQNVAPFLGNRIASVDAALNVTELPNIAAPGLPGDRSRLLVELSGIALDAAGRPWFGEEEVTSNGWRIGTPAGGGYEEFEVKPCAGSPCSGRTVGTGITDVTVAQDGSIWFTNQLRNEVGRFDYGTQTFSSYSLSSIDAGLANGQARAIATAPDGTLWVVEYGGYFFANANALVKLVPTQPTPTATVYHLGAGRYPAAVTADTSGNVWFTASTDSSGALIGRLAGVVAPVGGGGPVDRGRVVRAVAVARAGPPQVHGTSISFDQMCVGPPSDPCSLVFIVSQHEYVTGFSGSRNPGRASAAVAAVARARGRRRAAKPVILGKKSITLHGGQRKRVTVSLNATGKRLLRRRGRLTVYFTITQKGAPGKPPRRIKAVKLTFKVRGAGRRHR